MAYEKQRPATNISDLLGDTDLALPEVAAADLSVLDYGSNLENLDLLQGAEDFEFAPSVLEALLDADEDRWAASKTAGSVKKLSNTFGKKGASQVAGVTGKTLNAVNAVDNLVTGDEVKAKDAVALGRDVTSGTSDVIKMLTKSADGLDEVIDAEDIAKITRNQKWANRLGNNSWALSGLYNGFNLYDAASSGDTTNALKSGAYMSSDALGLAGHLMQSSVLKKMGGGIGVLPSLINLSNAKDGAELAYHTANSASSMLTAAGTVAGSTALSGAGGVMASGLAGWEAGSLIRAAADSDHAKAFYDDGVTLSDAAIDSAVATNMAFDKAGDSAQSWLTDHGMENVGSFANSVIDGTGFVAGAAQTLATSVPTALADAGAAAWDWAFGEDKKDRRKVVVDNG